MRRKCINAGNLSLYAVQFADTKLEKIIDPPLETLIVDGESAEELMCNICLEVLENPRQCRNGHLFCMECITPALALTPECPICRTALTEPTLARYIFGTWRFPFSSCFIVHRVLLRI